MWAGSSRRDSAGNRWTEMRGDADREDDHREHEKETNGPTGWRMESGVWGRSDMQVGGAAGARGRDMSPRLEAAPPQHSARGVVPRRWIPGPSPLRARSSSSAPLTRVRIRGCGRARGDRAPRPRGDEPRRPARTWRPGTASDGQRPWRAPDLVARLASAGCGSGAGRARAPTSWWSPTSGTSTCTSPAGGSRDARSCSTTWCRWATRYATAVSGTGR